MPYYIPLFFHILSLIIGFGAVIVIDTCGLLWIFKRVTLQFVTKVARITQPLIWIGWFGLAFSGIALLLLQDTITPLTILKLGLVLFAGINGVYLHHIKQELERVHGTQHLPSLLWVKMILATTVSQISWWGALVIGFINGLHPDPVLFPIASWDILFTLYSLYVLCIGIIFIKQKHIV